MAISLRVCDVDRSGPEPRYRPESDEELCEVGGRWDRRLKRWAGLAQSVQIVRVPRGSDQEQPARWLAEWFRRRARGIVGDHWDEPSMIPGPTPVEFRRVWTLMLVGGRRGGKSHLAVVSLVMFAVLSPRAQIWAISPTQEETDELEQAARSLMPLRWFVETTGRTAKVLTFRFYNGTRIRFLSGHKPRNLKRGRCDLALYNEGQNMSKAGWEKLHGAIADRAGMIVIACNPPDEPIGRWIEELYELARARKLEAEAFHLRGSNNPFVTAKVLEAMRAGVDDVTARKDIDGEMGVPIGDTVFHAWSDAQTIRPVPADFVDVTAECSKKKLGRAAAYVIGMDFQKDPHMVAAVLKFFRDPTDPAGDPIPWVVDEFVVPDTNEEGLLDAIEAKGRWTRAGALADDGYRGWTEAADDAAAPVHCAVVMDASAWWQDGEHAKGKKSDLRLRARKWVHLYRPQEDKRNNPDVVERVKVTNARLKTADTPARLGVPARTGARRMFVTPECLEVARAMKSWENRDGAPYRRSDFAHICDAVSYPVYRFFGSPKASRPGQYRGAARFGRREQLKGW